MFRIAPRHIPCLLGSLGAAVLACGAPAAAGPRQQPVESAGLVDDGDAAPMALTTSPVTHVTVRYSLAPGATSKRIKIPAADVPILLMGTMTTLNERGVGQVTLMRVKDQFLEWTGLESPFNSAITNGYSEVAGTHIFWLDYGHEVDVEVNDANSIVIHNPLSAPVTGTITMTY